MDNDLGDMSRVPFPSDLVCMLHDYFFHMYHRYHFLRMLALDLGIIHVSLDAYHRKEASDVMDDRSYLLYSDIGVRTCIEGNGTREGHHHNDSFLMSLVLSLIQPNNSTRKFYPQPCEYQWDGDVVTTS